MPHTALRSRRSLLAAALLAALAGVVLAGSLGTLAAGQQLVVYTYDSFASGPAQAIKEGFEAIYPDVEVVFLAPGSSGETLARIIAELNAGGTDADVFIGISDTQLPRAVDHGVFMQLDRALLPNLAKVPHTWTLTRRATSCPSTTATSPSFMTAGC